jgi:hypothetical protein
LLITKREDNRPDEKFYQTIAPLFTWVLKGDKKRYHEIKAEIVARAMRAAAETERPENITRENEIYYYTDIKRLAQSASNLEGIILISLVSFPSTEKELT